MNIDTALKARIENLQGKALDVGDMATWDSCNQALRGNVVELLELTDALARLDEPGFGANGCCCGRC